MRFAFGERHLDYTAENFLLSFSQPNFYFHATTTYDILRWKGFPIGKRDFMGKTRTRHPLKVPRRGRQLEISSLKRRPQSAAA